MPTTGWMLDAAADGGIFAFGDAAYLGSTATASGQPVVAVSAH